MSTRKVTRPQGRPRTKPVLSKERERQMILHINRMAGHAKCPLCQQPISATRDCACPPFAKVVA